MCKNGNNTICQLFAIFHNILVLKFSFLGLRSKLCADTRDLKFSSNCNFGGDQIS